MISNKLLIVLVFFQFILKIRVPSNMSSSAVCFASQNTEFQVALATVAIRVAKGPEATTVYSIPAFIVNIVLGTAKLRGMYERSTLESVSTVPLNVKVQDSPGINVAQT